MNEKDFIFSKSKELSLAGIRNFPADFINPKNFKTIEVPANQLVLSGEFFGTFEVSSYNNNFFMSFNNESEAKYVVYASRCRKNKIIIPEELTTVIKAVEDYEKYLDQLLHEIKKDYMRRFNNGKNFASVSNDIFKKLNLVRL